MDADADFRPRRPWIAFLLSLPFPGLGHIYAAAPLRGLLALAAFWLVLIPALLFVMVPLSFSPAAVIVGVVLSLALLLAIPIDAARVARQNRARPPGRWNRVAVYVVYAVAVTLLRFPLTTWWNEHFWFRSFKIPAGSMADTLLVGDQIMADMRESRLFPLKRGDVVVFRVPDEPEIFMTKRVIGLPGETVELRNGFLYIDGEAVVEAYIQPGYRGQDGRRNFGPIAVMEDHFFLLGDRRDRSADSRFWGQLPRALIEGRVRSIWWSVEQPPPAVDPAAETMNSWAAKAPPLFPRTRWERIGRPVL